MADPAVCSYLCKVLCSRGGCVRLSELPQEMGLSLSELRQVLDDAGQTRFLTARRGGDLCVLAVSPVRLCVRQVCAGCERLHLCKLNLRGRCRVNACKYSHDIYSEANRKVLKNHELSGLNEEELCVLLLQNDPFLFPDVCGAYNKGGGSCTLNDNCSRLHICRYFLKGECRFPRCKRSHNLLDPYATSLLISEGLDQDTIWNFQAICDARIATFINELRIPNSGTTAGKEHPNTHPKNERPPVTFNANNIVKGDQPDQALCKRALGTDSSCCPTLKAADTCQTALDPSLPPTQSTRLSLPQTPRLVQVPLQTTPLSVAALLATGMKRAPKSPSAEKEKSNDICLYYVWQFCKNKNNCSMIHYDLPYRWQIFTSDGWKDLPRREEIERAYCDPNINSFSALALDFTTMTSVSAPIRRLSTVSSVTKEAKFVMTTKWLWYWKNDQGQWIEYGKQDKQFNPANLTSDDLENLFLAEPKGSVQFEAGSQKYFLSFQTMLQRNMKYPTQREVRRRPKFVSSEDVRTKKGHTAATRTTPPPIASPVTTPTYPVNWDNTALPAIGYATIELNRGSPEFLKIENLFQLTMKNYKISKIQRIQNPSLWQVYQWQKEQMKKKKGGQKIDERLLFHGTSPSSLKAICTDNFDWRLCGTNGTVYGKGSYFARDASYSDNYCQAKEDEKMMFLAQVLVGEFAVGRAVYTRPPAKLLDVLNSYDSCVDNTVNPSIFVIFEKHQAYPAYLIFYREEKKCILS